MINGSSILNTTLSECHAEASTGPLGLSLGGGYRRHSLLFFFFFFSLIPSSSSVVLTLGAVISYVPQYISLLRSRSVKGLSWLWLLLNCVASFCLLLNSITLRWKELICCNIVSAAGCQVILLGVYQIGSAFVCIYPIYIFYVHAVRRGDEKFLLPAFVERCCRKPGTEHWARNAFFIFSFAFALPLAVAAAVLTNATGKGVATVSFGVAMGVISSLATLIMWIPQVLYTYRARDGGSLSVLMLMIQMPGNLGSAFFQAIVEQTSITTYGPYLVSALFQLALILMIVFFYFRKLRHYKPVNTEDTDADWASSSDDDVTEDELETTSLISRISEGFADDFADSISRRRVSSQIV